MTRRPPTDYRSECFQCGWTDYGAKSTASARRHRDKTNHHTACVVEQDYHFRPREEPA